MLLPNAAQKLLKCYLFTVSGTSLLGQPAAQMCPVTPLPAARPAFPAVPRPCLGDSLPLHIQHRVGIAASQRDDVILSIAGQAPLVLPVDGQGCARTREQSRCSRLPLAP